MGQEGPKISARFGVVDVIGKVLEPIFEAVDKKTEAEKQKRLDAIATKGIKDGTWVSFQGDEWQVDTFWTVIDGYIKLFRTISGDSVTTKEQVDPRKVEVAR